MKYVEEYLKDVVKVKPLGELTTKDEQELNGMSGEMVYIDGKYTDIFISHADYANWLERKYEQKSVVTIPKFKVGDWVVYNRDDYSREIIQVYDIRDGRYYFNDNIHFSWSIKECDEKSHLWSIEDAKDGDVLAFDNETIVIFKDLYNATTFHSYCHIEDGLFDISKNEMPDWWEGKGFYPATKEQRDILFQKMKESGYTWDDKKKKLKKIEEKPQLKEGNFYECFKSYHYLGGGQYWFDKGKVYFCEKDGYLRSDPNNNNIYVYDCKNWQSYFRPYTEETAWNEEDEKMLVDCFNILHRSDYPIDKVTKTVNWLKSLRPQNKWKPSDEQMNTFKQVYDWYNTHFAQSLALNSLYYEMKKLKGE